MQPRRGLPSHPSLPVAPHLRQNHNQTTWNSQSPTLSHSAQGSSNLQSQAWQNSYQLAPHYAQAYLQYNNAAPSSWPTTTPEGYAYSSNFVTPRPGIAPGYGDATPNFAGPSQTWYQPGNVRCKQPGCTFTGSGNAVETHMMDRHLIYPPGWENRNRRPDWDADPSLKGYAGRYMLSPVYFRGKAFILLSFLFIENPYPFKERALSLTLRKPSNSG